MSTDRDWIASFTSSIWSFITRCLHEVLHRSKHDDVKFHAVELLVPLRWWYGPSQYTVWGSLLIEWCTRFWLIASDDLYVEMWVTWLTLTLSVRLSQVGKTFWSDTGTTLKRWLARLFSSHCFVSFSSDSLIHSMSHRTWISLIDWFVDCLISWFINRLTDWLLDCFVGCLPDWMNEVGEADERSDEVDGSSDRSTGRTWFFGERGLNDDCSTKDSSDDLTWDPSDDSTESPSDYSSGCFKFSVIEDDCLTVDWFSDCSSDWPSGCSSSWLCGGERADMSDEMNGRLYDEIGGNRLYNCLLNADGNSDDWKNFENRGEKFFCTERSRDDDFWVDCIRGSVDCMRDSVDFDDSESLNSKRRCACHE
jgi:hypothetical protein